MRIELGRTLCGVDIGEQRCAICRRRFWLGPATAFAICDDDVLLGEVCPACLEGGPEYMERTLAAWARLARLSADEQEKFAEEGFDEEEVPTLDEYLMAERVYQTPLFQSAEEAEAAGY
jgi:hypothetical protein